MPQGGTITFVTRSISGPVSEESGASERQLQVEVKDNGIGMDERPGNVVWSRFFPPRPSAAAPDSVWRWFTE